MSYKFKAGETYQTRGGADRLIAYISPTDLVTRGTKYRMIAIRSPSKGIVGYTIDGKAIDEDTTNHDLMPPKRQIWVAVWRDRGCATVKTFACDNECHAERVASKDNRSRIAVLGPIDVEAEP